MHIKIGNERAKVCFMNLIMCKFSKGNLMMCCLKRCKQYMVTEESHSKFKAANRRIALKIPS